MSFRMLDLNLLRVLDAMMIEGSVGGAASRLSVTPSAVSHALGRLRALFDDPLFIRSPGGMRATPRASEIGIKVREGLHSLEGALASTAFVAAESRRVFTIACSAYVSAVLLPGVITRLRSRAPRAAISVASWGPGLFDRFEAGQIDVLLGDFVRVPDGYECRDLFEDRLVWLMGRDYVLDSEGAGRRRPLEALEPDRAHRTVLEYGFVRRVTVDECCGIVGNPVGRSLDRPVLESLPHALIAPLLVKQAELAALLPQRLAQLFARDLRLDMVESAAAGPATAIRIAAVRHPAYGRREPVVWFCDLLAEVAAGLGGLSQEKNTTGEEPHALPR
ncbi:LysR family transcriptional regulator [Dongia sedimenti]|uniref:LysR family transcriptional regulator n=1 Tax=Dongia sedimenti TaxID=3064282 RepID=A0ABU0YN17_9PROT|nr:LysR family transcriptional regulator [Rhodospirillaceae bacterium R-7]